MVHKVLARRPQGARSRFAILHGGARCICSWALGMVSRSYRPKFIEDVAGFREPLVFGEGLAPPEGFFPDNTTYRDKFWITPENEGAYFALGHCGQICYIHPRSEVVIVRFASAKELEPKYCQVLKGLADIARALFDTPSSRIGMARIRFLKGT